MSLAIDLSVPGAAVTIDLRAGLTTIIVGANGSGKTRLATECEKQLGGNAHRISAQRMLALDPEVEKIAEAAARSKLRYGYKNPQDYGGVDQTRQVNRWGKDKPSFILDDAGALIQVLYAEQANTAVAAHNARLDGVPSPAKETLVRKLQSIFHRVLPTRKLEITADDIKVIPVNDDIPGEPYSITKLSDGEKAVFYMIGQALVADPDTVLIMDEPEIHVHRSILARIWDELEAARPDCGFLLITHDLEFAASRAGKKYVVSSYDPSTGWSLEDVPEAEDFSEELVTLILGSRKPVLFIEGDQGSFDIAFYRACYPGWTIIPRGGCESVIHSVVTMRRNSAFTRIKCAGLVDADGHDAADRENLASHGVSILPVSEIENLLLLPSVSRAILEMNEIEDAALEKTLDALKAAIFADASKEINLNEVVVGYCRRRIDRMLKQIDLSASTSINNLASDYATRTSSLDVVAIADEMRTKVGDAIAKSDLPALLALYDRKKPLLALAASHLRNWRVDVFSAWVSRAIQSTRDDRLRIAIRAVLPEPVAA